VEGYCIKCGWQPGEIEYPEENLPEECTGLFAQLLAARRRLYQRSGAETAASAPPESRWMDGWMPVPPAPGTAESDPEQRQKRRIRLIHELAAFGL
jgi:hypothetical protein